MLYHFKTDIVTAPVKEKTVKKPAGTGFTSSFQSVFRSSLLPKPIAKPKSQSAQKVAPAPLSPPAGFSTDIYEDAPVASTSKTVVKPTTVLLRRATRAIEATPPLPIVSSGRKFQTIGSAPVSSILSSGPKAGSSGVTTLPSRRNVTGSTAAAASSPQTVSTKQPAKTGNSFLVYF